MLSNYLKIAWRNLVKFKAHSLINIIGLAIGVAFCALTFLFIRHEHSYDKFHANSDRIYMTYVQRESSGGRKPSGATPPILSPTLRSSIPEIENTVRVHGWTTKEGVPVRHDNRVQLKEGYMVDPDFLRIFSFPVLSGDPANALKDQSAVIITDSMAEAYFGNSDPINHELFFRIDQEEKPFVIKAVVGCPRKSSLQFDFLLSYALIQAETHWGSNNLYTFILASPNTNAASLEKKLLTFFSGYFQGQKNENGGYFGSPDRPLKLIPLEHLYLNNVIRKWITLQSDPAYSYVLMGIALSVMLTACFNFINISLGLSSTRFKEVGLRKVVGARRIQLIKQHLSESLLLTVLSLLIGLFLAHRALPYFSRLMDRGLKFDFMALLLPILILTLSAGFFAGFYPALVLSGFHPAQILKGKLRIHGKRRLSSGLVVLQFALSILLIITTLTMANQMRFMRNRHLGFNADQVLLLDGGGWGVGLSREGMHRMLEVYRQLAQQRPEIINTTMTSMSFGRGDLWGTGFAYRDRQITCRMYTIDYDYAETLGINIVAGREFSRDFPGDREESVIVNQSLVNIFEWDQPLGKSIPADNDMLPGTIIGVFEDSHLRSLHYEVEPAVYHLKRINGTLRYILLRVAPEGLPETIRLLEDTWKEAVPDRPFVYSFLDEDIDRVFKEDERWADLSRAAAVFAVLIACMGAFGLTSLAVARRTKEVGIRKVLGASEMKIALLLSRDFTALVLLANAAAWPVAWLILRRWLQDFAYRVSIAWELFVLGAVITLFIAMAAVSGQVVKAARMETITSLRYE